MSDFDSLSLLRIKNLSRKRKPHISPRREVLPALIQSKLRTFSPPQDWKRRRRRWRTFQPDLYLLIERKWTYHENGTLILASLFHKIILKFEWLKNYKWSNLTIILLEIWVLKLRFFKLQKYFVQALVNICPYFLL